MRISWGVMDIDRTIGMIEGGVLTLFYGLTGSGKTTLSTYIPILRIVQEKKGKLDKKDAIFIVDTDGGFDLPRFEQILNSNGLDFNSIADNIRYYNVTEFEEQHKVITKDIPDEIEKQGLKPLLISVDPIVAIYRGIILRTDLKYRAAVIGTYTGKLDLQLTTLRRIAVQYDCPAFVTTWPSSGVGEALTGKPPEQPFIGGRQMGFLPKIIAEIVVPQLFSPVRIIRLFKARGLPAGLEGKFRLTDKGIAPVEG